MFFFKKPALLVGLLLPAVAFAFPIAIPGTEGLRVIVASTDPIFATYEGNSATYSNDLLLNGSLIFNNHSTPVGTTISLGSFSIGTELIFELHVQNTGYSFFTGPGSRNPDGHDHARVQSEWQPNTTLVSFEDLFGGSFDYNDLSFSFTNTIAAPVPEASPLSMFALGVAGLCLLASRRREA